jgi:hypothetical protein
MGNITRVERLLTEYGIDFKIKKGSILTYTGVIKGKYVEITDIGYKIFVDFPMGKEDPLYFEDITLFRNWLR